MTDTIRLATPADAAAIAEIYAPFCTEHTTSFETVAPGRAEMAQRIQKTLQQHPWLVMEAHGSIAGYAYASRHRERAAYRWAVDVAAYVHASRRGQGVGRRLYQALIGVLAAQHYFRAYAGISLPNEASVALHEAVGFHPLGVYRGVGYKLGAWRDVGWWELALQPLADPPPEPRAIASLIASGDLARLLAS